MQLSTRKISPRPHRGSHPALSAAVFATGLDWMALAHRDDVLCGLTFGHATPRQAVAALCRMLGTTGRTLSADVIDGDSESTPVIEDVIDRLCRFAAGESVEFSDVEIDDRHLATFGRRVVAACRRIPLGQTRTYGQLAAVCGSPGAARAVGQVMARNRYPLIVPCHRVLAAGGALGGFSAPQGLAMKRRLLAMESTTMCAPQSS